MTDDRKADGRGCLRGIAWTSHLTFAHHRTRRAPPFWLLVLIAISGTAAMHMLVPALPDAAVSLAAASGQIQLAISIYIIGLAIGQLFYGPLSDAFGRRAVLMAGQSLYVAGSVAVGLAPNLHILLCGRLVQALGSCAGLAVGRAIVRDTSDGTTAISRLALLNLTIALSPGLAPMAGGLIAASWGWRWMFALLSVVGTIMLWLTWRMLPETGKPNGEFGCRILLRDYCSLVRSTRFLGFALSGGCTTSIYAILSAAPFIFIYQLHQPVQMAGVYSGLMVMGAVVGNFVTATAARRVPDAILLRAGNMLGLVSAASLLAIVILGRLNVYVTVAGVMLFACGTGIMNPVALARTISIDPRLVGSSAGLFGFLQMTVGALCTTLTALGGDPARSALTTMVVATVISRIAFTLALKSDTKLAMGDEMNPERRPVARREQ